MLRVNAGNDIWGNASYISIPLVGYGKHGANGIIREIESGHKTSLDHKQVILKGTLLYTDGRTIMQVSSNDIASVKIIPGSTVETATVQKDLGFRKVKGEIIDPKCYFGVMKPGEGKVHRDCAIRCILGGIPPMMHVWNDKGESNYYLLVSSTGIDINKAVQDYVAEPVELEARLVQYGDWTLMYVADMKNIRPISFPSTVPARVHDHRLRYRLHTIKPACSVPVLYLPTNNGSGAHRNALKQQFIFQLHHVCRFIHNIFRHRLLAL